MQETADIYRRLVDVQPDTFRPRLAKSLFDLGVRLGEIGRRHHALAAV